MLQYRERQTLAGSSAADEAADGFVPRWYVACTMARHEKQVAAQLAGRAIECFLPLYDEVHRWKDRRKTITLPLFPGYLFVRIPLLERLRVQVLPGVSRLVGFGGLPVALDDLDIERLRQGLATLRAEPHPFLKLGQTVRVKSGPLSGATGILERYREKFRVILSMDLIQQSVAVEIDLCDLEII
ncbi:MAG: UpxY family transcription antiterminator [Terriglobia bacterium]|jgi:transcription antitermination factor NusG|nr:UpxY family transcription antiterminator [Terriglobia bacterium]